MIKYSFIMPYYNRHKELAKTLESFRRLYSHRKDYEVIIVSDYVSRDIADLNLLLYKRFADITARLALSKKGGTLNPCSHRNLGSGISTGKILIHTSPECCHKNDILCGLDGIDINDDTYVVCACESVDENMNHIIWYQHSKLNNRMLHFCSAITRDKYFKLGGFDEAFDGFCGYDDDDFLRTVKHSGMKIICRDDLIVQHIEHDRGHQKDAEKIKAGEDYLNKKWDRILENKKGDN